MTGYQEVFGGGTIYPSQVSYLALALTGNVTLEWPLEANTGNDIVARIIDITPTGAYSITMPPASQTGTGNTTLFNNLGPSTVTILDADGGTLLSLTAGTVWQLYLTDNSDDAGTWRSYQNGASTSQAQASALAGYGLVAQGSLLSTNAPTTEFNANYTLGVADRAGNFVWVGASGTLTLLTAVTATNGYYVLVRNGGTGQLTIDPTGSETINGDATLVLQPNDSVIVVCSGAAWYTIGYGQDAVFAFDYTSISLTGEVNDYTLAGAELNRIAYSFTGVLTTDMEIIVPATTQQYWVSNDTSGSFNLSVRATGQVTGVTVAQGARSILYCDGTNVVNAATGGLATPIAITDGGTGSTTAGGALINLGGTATGIGVFTAASQAAARTAIGASAEGGAANFTSIGATVPGTGVFTTLSATGLLDISAAGAGQIQFPATQNASANANTLDDYEEGTVTLTDGSGAGLSFTSMAVEYTKIGNKVMIGGQWQFPSTANGSASIIAGLPYAVANSANAASAGSMRASAPASIQVNPISLANTTTFQMFQQTGGVANSALSTSAINFSLTYRATA